MTNTKLIMSVWTVMFMLTGSVLYAQQSHEELAIVQNLFGMNKRSLYEKTMTLSAADSVGFWPLYDTYESKRTKAVKNTIDATKKFISVYPNTTHEQINDMIMDISDANDYLRDLILDYYSDIRKTTSAQTAAMFYQIESYILNALELEINNSLPFLQSYSLSLQKRK